MKTKAWILLLALILLLCALLSFYIFRPGEAAAFAEIVSQGQVIHTVSLHRNQTILVTTEDGGSNTVTVKDGFIAVTDANCPDHYCMHRGFCDRGTQIVCLPNGLIIRFTAPQEVDGVVG